MPGSPKKRARRTIEAMKRLEAAEALKCLEADTDALDLTEIWGPDFTGIAGTGDTALAAPDLGEGISRASADDSPPHQDGYSRGDRSAEPQAWHPDVNPWIVPGEAWGRYWRRERLGIVPGESRRNQDLEKICPPARAVEPKTFPD